jgi:thiol-disulfide isomerase/thioredoxin
MIYLVSCERPTQFSSEALGETFLNWNEEEVTFKEIANQHKGSTVLIDIWASWCKDCIVTLPELKLLQKEYPEVKYVFLSLDRTPKSWKRGVERFQIQGEHYYMKEGKKGPLGDFLNLWWIPRYVVLNEKGDIVLYKATKITDKNILEALKK